MLHFQSYFNPQQGWTVRGSIPSVGKMFSLLHTQAGRPTLWGPSAFFTGTWYWTPTPTPI